MLFGGEPTLNMTIITAICNIVFNKLKKKIRIGIITNLVCSKETIRKLITIAKKNNLEITCSVDGPQCINDKNRIFKNGKGSYSIVNRNIKLIVENNIDIFVECTYTKAHIDENISIVDLLKHFYSEYGIRRTHIAFDINLIDADDLYWEKMVKYYIEAIDYCFNKNEKDNLTFSFLERILSVLYFNEVIEAICPAIENDIAVDINGKYFPCFMLYNNQKYEFSTVKELREHRKSIFNLHFNKTHSECLNCWVRKFCFGCAASDCLLGDSFNKKHCYFIKKIVTQCLLRVLEKTLNIPFMELANCTNNS